jgi:Transporter associated domain
LPGSTPLHLLTGLAGLELEDGAAATIGGYVTDRLGRLSTVGERAAVGAWDIVVERATDHRVISTRLVRHGSAAAHPLAPERHPVYAAMGSNRWPPVRLIRSGDSLWEPYRHCT